MTNDAFDVEPPVPPNGATERERDEAAMAWLRWDHRRRMRGESPRAVQLDDEP